MAPIIYTVWNRTVRHCAVSDDQEDAPLLSQPAGNSNRPVDRVVQSRLARYEAHPQSPHLAITTL
jgi:hypothetical protein